MHADQVQPTHVFTLGLGLPVRMLDQILTATEHTLTQAGATRIWAEPSAWGTVVMAELPADANRPSEDRNAHGGAERLLLRS
jgi:hypothetical protein